MPFFRFYDASHAWSIENEGVAPDIEVIDRPELIAAGQDPSLEEGVKYLLLQLERTGKNTAFISMCCGSALGTGAVLERLD